jgi:hypothetical protein
MRKLVVAKLRQLRGPEHRLVAHQQRRVDLGVAVLAGVQVEHEVGQRALQPCQRALQHHEARAGQLRRRLEVHQPERLADLEMLPGLEVERARAPQLAHLDVGGFVRPHRHVVGRHIGDGGQRLVQLVIDLLGRGFGLRHPLLDPRDLAHQRLGARLVLRLLGLADLLRRRVAPLLQALQFRDQPPALLVERHEALGLRLQPTALERPVEGLRVVADPADVVHGRVGTLIIDARRPV